MYDSALQHRDACKTLTLLTTCVATQSELLAPQDVTNLGGLADAVALVNKGLVVGSRLDNHVWLVGLLDLPENRNWVCK